MLISNPLPPVAINPNRLIDLDWNFANVENLTAEGVLSTPVNRSAGNPQVVHLQGQAIDSSQTGGAVAGVADATTRSRYIQVTTGAGVRTTRLFRKCGGVPSGLRIGVAPTLVARALRRYDLSVFLRWPLRGTAVLTVGLALTEDAAIFAGGGPAFMLSSDPAVNAGEWTPRVKQVDGAGINTGASTQLSPNTVNFAKFGARYTEGASPLLELLINDVSVSSLQGYGVVPETNAVQSFGLAWGATLVAGTTVNWRDYRFICEEI